MGARNLDGRWGFSGLFAYLLVFNFLKERKKHRQNSHPLVHFRTCSQQPKLAKPRAVGGRTRAPELSPAAFQVCLSRELPLKGKLGLKPRSFRMMCGASQVAVCAPSDKSTSSPLWHVRFLSEKQGWLARGVSRLSLSINVIFMYLRQRGPREDGPARPVALLDTLGSGIHVQWVGEGG